MEVITKIDKKDLCQKIQQMMTRISKMLRFKEREKTYQKMLCEDLVEIGLKVEFEKDIYICYKRTNWFKTMDIYLCDLNVPIELKVHYKTMKHIRQSRKEEIDDSENEEETEYEPQKNDSSGWLRSQDQLSSYIQYCDSPYGILINCLIEDDQEEVRATIIDKEKESLDPSLKVVFGNSCEYRYPTVVPRKRNNKRKRVD